MAMLINYNSTLLKKKKKPIILHYLHCNVNLLEIEFVTSLIIQGRCEFRTFDVTRNPSRQTLNFLLCLKEMENMLKSSLLNNKLQLITETKPSATLITYI